MPGRPRPKTSSFLGVAMLVEDDAAVLVQLEARRNFDAQGFEAVLEDVAVHKMAVRIDEVLFLVAAVDDHELGSLHPRLGEHHRKAQVVLLAFVFKGDCTARSRQRVADQVVLLGASQDAFGRGAVEQGD
ncbi:hypothetical protein D3C72_1815430 [compost metagenome]